jgi:hypothetical protein
MVKISRYFGLLFALCSVLPVLGRGDSNALPNGAVVPSDYEVVTVSDLHFNPFYDPSLYSRLIANDPSQWAAIFQEDGAGALPMYGADTNYPLLVLTLADMRQHMGASPVVLFTGDMLGHYIPENFYCEYYQHVPMSACTLNFATFAPGLAAAAAMQQFIDKTFAFVAGEIREYVGDAPVFYVPGNIDTYDLAGYGPDNNFLTNNSATVFNKLLNGSVDRPMFSTFAIGGYYAAHVGSKLNIIGLNSNSFVPGAPTYWQAARELEWLDIQLGIAQTAGKQVWILMHVPPGANSQAMAGDTPGKLDEDQVSMNWDQDLQAKFMDKLSKHPGLVTLMLAGHTHMDEYRILPSGDVLEQLPGISPCFGNNPAYKVLSMMPGTYIPVDYESFDLNLLAKPAPTHFQSLYTFSTAYPTPGDLNNSLQQAYAQLLSNETQRESYIQYYVSGSLVIHPINQGNWPIFSCTIGDIDELDYIDCVNNY